MSTESPSTTRTPSFTLSLHALLTFPLRLCNPPPAASSVRSCKVTPLIKVSLDDVLNKRHLPPLTLKDFEEWLVFVEGTPQYLYFILWLREYETRYILWLEQYGHDYSQPLSPTSLSYLNLIPSSPSLALFYTRAKQTFLDPFTNPPSPYALPPAALSPSTHSLSASIPHFNVSPEEACRESIAAFSAHPHPHPKELASVANYARSVLKDSLERFATTACHNVGTRRAWCGIAGGFVLTLIIGVLPTLLTIFYAPTRWWRIMGWLGCWIGGTVILSSLHGICMMIYLFGDLRQLRSFELARPKISQPKAIARARPRLRSLFTRDDSTGSSYESSDAQVPAAAPQATPGSPSPTCVLPTPPTTPQTMVSQTSTGTPIVHLAFSGTVLDTISESNNTDGSESVVETPAKKRTSITITSGNESTKHVLRASDLTIWQNAASTLKRWVNTRTTSLAFSTSDDRSRTTGTRVDMVGDQDTQMYSSRTQAASNSGTFGVRSWFGGITSRPRATVPIEFDDESYVGSPIQEKNMIDTFLAEMMEEKRADSPYAAPSIISLPASDPDEYEDNTPRPRPASAVTFASSVLENHSPVNHLRLTMDAVDARRVQPQMVSTTTTTTTMTTDTRTIQSFRSPSTDPDPPLFYRTAAFIKRDYPSDMLDEIPPPRTSHEIVREERATHGTQAEPVHFDFDKLPVPAPLHPFGSGGGGDIISGLDQEGLVIPVPIVAPPPSTAPLRIRPKPALAGAVPPLPALPLNPTTPFTKPKPIPVVFPPPKPARSKLWMDTCPRHPAVEAKFAAVLAAQQQALAEHQRNQVPVGQRDDPAEIEIALPSPATSHFTDVSGTTDCSSTQHSTKYRLFLGGGLPASSILRPMPRLQPGSSSSGNGKSKGRGSTTHARSARANGGSDDGWRARLRTVKSVPAFGPLTRVLEPIVARGQWEIVVRSACYAAVGAWLFVGCLLALPVAK